MNNIQPSSYEMIYAIVDHGHASKFLHKAMDYGIRGGTILYGKGTVSNPILNFLSLYDEEKEIILMGAESGVAKEAMQKLNDHFKLHKPGRGIAFSTGLDLVRGSTLCERDDIKKEEATSMYKLIITIVNRGKAEDVIDAAKEKGARGGTIMNARGSGVNENFKVFNMDIEPEKEMVLVIVKEDIFSDIVSNIEQKLELSEPGNGIIFVQDLKRVYGIYEDKK
ncbi:MAG: P-II family nitrogen regulator [Tissierellia bacterium]|nr:P-II family nitrogen regulator [Tissierellia bacterium]